MNFLLCKPRQRKSLRQNPKILHNFRLAGRIRTSDSASEIADTDTEILSSQILSKEDKEEKSLLSCVYESFFATCTNWNHDLLAFLFCVYFILQRIYKTVHQVLALRWGLTFVWIYICCISCALFNALVRVRNCARMKAKDSTPSSPSLTSWREWASFGMDWKEIGESLINRSN